MLAGRLRSVYTDGMDDLDECTCGHVRDEHHDGDPEMGHGCAVEGCDCFHFDAAE